MCLCEYKSKVKVCVCMCNYCLRIVLVWLGERARWVSVVLVCLLLWVCEWMGVCHYCACVSEWVTYRVTEYLFITLFFGGTSSHDESELAIFKYKDDDKTYVSDEELAQELGREYVPPRSQLTYESDRQIAKERIIQRRCKNCGIEITNKSEPTLSMIIRFRLCNTMLHNIYNFLCYSSIVYSRKIKLRHMPASFSTTD